MTEKPETLAELQARLDGAPVLLADGNFGMVIRVPTANHPDEVGIQVPGEDDIRWLDLSTLSGYPPLERRP